VALFSGEVLFEDTIALLDLDEYSSSLLVGGMGYVPGQ
jgi:hypothetical protein